MRIGINLLYLLPGLVGGTETYALCLLQGLAQVDHEDEYFVFLNRESANWPLPESMNFTRVTCPVSGNSRGSRYFFEQVRLPRLLKQLEIDVVHSLGYVAPLFAPCPSIVTIPDLNFRVLREQMPLIRRLSLEFFVKRAAVRASCVIAISEFTRRAISEAFNLGAGRTVVTHLAPKQREEMGIAGQGGHIPIRFGIRSPYMVAFGNQFLHKNIPRLVQAFKIAKEKFRLPHQLVVIGHPCSGGKEPPDGRGVGAATIIFTGYLDDASVRDLLRRAEALVFPSIHEGFGIPVLEAMQVGVPVVCSNRTALPEIAGDAAVFFDPYSVEDMSEKITLVAKDPVLRDDLRQKGFANVKRFSWESTALKTLAVYRSVFRSQAPVRLA